FPLGSFSVTMAAIVSFRFSERSVAPKPFAEVLEPMEPSAAAEPPLEPAANDPANARLRSDSRERCDSLRKRARSLMVISTVRISPTSRARGSVKRWLCRSLHREYRATGGELLFGSV